MQNAPLLERFASRSDGSRPTAGQATGALQQARAERDAELMGELGSASRSVANAIGRSVLMTRDAGAP